MESFYHQCGTVFKANYQLTNRVMVTATLLYVDRLSGIPNNKIHSTHTAKTGMPLPWSQQMTALDPLLNSVAAAMYVNIRRNSVAGTQHPGSQSES